MKKIIVIYATAGIGHKKAAMAVKQALDETASGEAQVTLIDALDYTNDFFKWSYLKAYLLMVNKMPLFWGLMYYITDNFYVNLIVSALRRFNNWLNSFKLADYLIREAPDVVISTHFFASEVISDMRKRKALNTHLITVVTDYRLHSWWVSDFVDTYVVASEAAREDLLRWKTPPSRIKVLGIPIEPVFSKDVNKSEVLKKAGLQEGVFTILVIGGGFGVGPIEDIVKAINGISREVQVIAICGHNEELVGKLEAIEAGMKARMKVLGFVNNVYEYMASSDILISKSGGITVSESLAKELPMIVISPIIGQETRNSDFLINSGAGLKIDNVSELKETLEGLLSNPEKVAGMRRAIKAIKKPSSCYDVAKLAVETASKNKV